MTTYYYEGVAAAMLGLSPSSNPYRRLMRLQWAKRREASRLLYIIASAWDGGYASAVSLSPERHTQLARDFEQKWRDAE